MMNETGGGEAIRWLAPSFLIHHVSFQIAPSIFSNLIFRSVLPA